MKVPFITRIQIGLGIVLGAAAAIAHPGQAGKAVAEGPFQWKQQPVVAGETNRYNLEIRITPSSTPEKVIKISEQFDRLTRAAKADGSLTLVDTFRSGTVSFGAAPQDILKMLPVVIITRDKNGKFASKADGGSAEGNPEVLGVLQQFAATSESLLPGKPVHVGEKWKIAFANVNTLLGGSKLAGEAERVDTESIDGKNATRLKFTFYAQEGDKQSQGGGTVTLDMRRRIIRLSQQGHGTFAGGPAIVEIELQRVEVKK